VKIYGSVMNKDVTKKCWIIAEDFRIHRVTAQYTRGEMKWRYYDSDRSHARGYLYPLNMHLLGNSSYWGDGWHYDTRAEAAKDQCKLINMEIRRVKKVGMIDLGKQVKKLRELLKENLCTVTRN
jgi:hypothetical protein